MTWIGYTLGVSYSAHEKAAINSFLHITLYRALLSFPLVIHFLSVSRTPSQFGIIICFDSYNRAEHMYMCYALTMCHTITNSEQFSIVDPWAVKMCLYVRDFLIFISTDVKLKPRQNEFISTQIFYLNKYNKIFGVCVCTCVRHIWARKLNGKIFVCATENTNCEQIDIISYIKAINTYSVQACTKCIEHLLPYSRVSFSAFQPLFALH